MRVATKASGLILLPLAAVLGGCGGSIKGNGPDGSTSPGACASLGACECLAAGDRCKPRSEPCWCPSECYPGAPIDCLCGGGQFLACEDLVVAGFCTTEVAAVQSKCPVQGQYIGDVCSSSRSPSCVAGCLANLKATGSCDELNCLCPLCDCIPPETPTFTNCLGACNPPLAD